MKSLRTSSTPELRPVGRVHTRSRVLLTLLSAVLSLCLGSTTLSPALVPQGPPGPAVGYGGGADHPVRPPAPHLRLPAGRNGSGGLRGGDPERPEQSPGRPQHLRGQLGGGPDGGAVLRSLPQSVTLTPPGRLPRGLPGVLLVLLIAERTGASRITLVLAGVAVSNLFSAGIDALVTFFHPMRCSAIPTSVSAG